MQASNILYPGHSQSEGFIHTLRKKRSLSFYTGLVSLLMIPVYILLSQIDPRTVVGANTWIKPLKFAVSIGIFLWTMAWFLELLEDFPTFRDRIEKYFVISTAVELLLITFQSARGVQSHFNQSSAFDGAIYSIMGMFIFPMIPVAIMMDRKFGLLGSKLDPRVLTAVRFSLWIFAIASVVGVFMSARLAHAVGVPDGGPGLPLVNWSKNGGDIRIAHFAGIHSLQILPLFAFFAVKRSWNTLSVKIVSIGYTILVGAVFVNAMLGRPLI
ncbi:hypothetical protein [Leptospira licerasiae]|uniref:Membrane protein n=1 Tax=Leptospira licerasiae str. MMD4847 TaxID=1049971 RepID=A0ABP2RHL3_9LEPT|nr:hypothetical protein [Leptospira licerasiae]EIE02533.1 hypothetical protein LEP1GSC185_1176 [Leptospira licerasiae serovar Varillal str. VAR 010]EJZ43115.1 putative membrane protein [Leptospira licerasiae str. MMD4847]